MKRFISLFVFVLASLSAYAWLAVNGICYEFLDNDRVYVVDRDRHYNICGNIVIPETIEYKGKTYRVVFIDDHAFYGCSGLTSVTIPNSVKSIGKYAFCGCSGLTSVTIPNSIRTIHDKTFCGCSGLTSITIPNSVTSIGEQAFYRCSGLTSVTIPNSVTFIGCSAFQGCSGLNSITIPNSISTIYDNTFSDCSSLTSVTIPNSVTSIGSGAFSGCSGLTSVTIPNSVKSIGGLAFDGCSGLTSVTIPNSIRTIHDKTFYGCSGLTSVTIPNSVTTIGGYAFSSCSSLTSVTISNSVTWIGSRAFEYCSSLRSITIPNSVTHMGDLVFYNCRSLSSITSLNPIPPIIVGTYQIILGKGNQWDGYYGKVATLYVPKGKRGHYINSPWKKSFNEIIEIDEPSDIEVPSESSIGDLNGDGHVDFADIEEIENYIMGSPSGNFNTEKADYNGDGSVNVADIVSIIDNNKWITVTDNFSKSIPFTKIRVLNNKSISDQYCCVAFSTSPNEDVGTDRFYINFSTLTIGDNNPNSISWGNPITNYKHVGGNWYEYEFSCPVYFAYRQQNCPSGQVMALIRNNEQESASPNDETTPSDEPTPNEESTPNVGVVTKICKSYSQPPVVGAIISDYSDNNIKEKGFIVSENSNNLIYDENSKESAFVYNRILDYRVIDCTEYGKEQFWCPLRALKADKTYYVKPYIIHSNGDIIYGGTESIHTQSFNRYNGTTDYANVFKASTNTLFDLVTDEIIDANDDFYYSTNESPTSVGHQIGTHNIIKYKFKTEWNYKLWYYHSSHCVQSKRINPPLFTIQGNKLYIEKNPLDIDKDITIFYSINGDYFRPENYVDVYVNPIDINEPCIVYCYAKSSDGYISYTNMYVINSGVGQSEGTETTVN